MATSDRLMGSIQAKLFRGGGKSRGESHAHKGSESGVTGLPASSTWTPHRPATPHQRIDSLSAEVAWTWDMWSYGIPKTVRPYPLKKATPTTRFHNRL